ncbi:MAG: hypothetical protein V8Q83_05785 [Blautia sp.]
MQIRKKISVLISTFVFLLLFCATSVTAHAAGTKEYLGTIFVNGTSALHAKIDLTGDGKADRLDAWMTGRGWSGNSKFDGTLLLSVNGNKAQQIGLTDDTVIISYVALSKSVQMLRIQTGSSAYDSDDLWVKYNKSVNKFKVVLNEKLGGLVHGLEKYRTVGDVTIINKNAMKIKYFIQPYVTGPIYAEYTYVYSKGSLKRKSNTAVATSMFYKSQGSLTVKWLQDGYQKYFYGNKFVAAKQLTFYHSPGGKKYFSLKKNDIATLKGFYSKGKNSYLVFRYNNKKGYIKIGRNQLNSFYGVTRRYVN